MEENIKRMLKIGCLFSLIIIGSIIYLIFTNPKIKGAGSDYLIGSYLDEEYSKEIPEQGITYAFGINGKETYQTNIDEVGELKVKGDKPSSGTITLTQNKRIIINDLVSKNKKWCAKKALNGNVIVGKSKDLNCIINEEEIIVDKKACSLEKKIINEITEYAASMNVLLTYYKLEDNLKDDNGLKDKVAYTIKKYIDLVNKKQAKK